MSHYLYVMMDEFVVAVDKAQDSKEIVAALNKFPQSAEGAKEEMLQIAEKYPEFVASHYK
ncbi:MAG: hypothetical protein RAO92_05850 [Candidatus Euphemobacter frigidus]|nr:hypothetical protein [Candidatus Euphemobacter frigidus]MDP8275908.1 hypothetical protein [Candidatus Euphemobacter frigidus]